jgi:hypothetical protein
MNTFSEEYGGKGYKIWNCGNDENNKAYLDDQRMAKAEGDYLNANNQGIKKRFVYLFIALIKSN